MKEEIFPLVDESGLVIGQECRSRCHDGSMLLHPVVHLHLFNRLGELYLQKRSLNKDIYPGRWDTSVGGHIDLGETPGQALTREAREELGLVGFGYQIISRHIIETQYEREYVYCFYTITEMLPQPDLDEVTEGRFWTIQEIIKNLDTNIFTPNFEYDFNTVIRQLGAER